MEFFQIQKIIIDYYIYYKLLYFSSVDVIRGVRPSDVLTNISV